MDPNKATEETQESMPDSNKESEQTQDAAPKEENLETSADGSEKLPDGVSKRTQEQFDKLKGQTTELKEQLRQLRERTFNEQRFQKAEELKPLYDKTTGLVNLEALEDIQRKAETAEKRSAELEERMRQGRVADENRELFSAHPELKDPKTKEAKELFDESERIWMHSQAYPEKYGGMPLTQKQAADLAKKRVNSQGSQAPAETVESKEQASFAASGRPSQGVQNRVTSEEELDRLRLGTRIGDKQAMIDRMKAIREAK